MNSSQVNPTPRRILLTVAKFMRLFGLTQTTQLLLSHAKIDCCNDEPATTLTAIETEGEKLARYLLGEDFLLPEDVSKIYDFHYSDEQRRVLAMSVPDFQSLQWLRSRGYMLIAPPPIDYCLHQFRNLTNQPRYRRREEWIARPPQRFFKNDVVRAGTWLMIRKKPYTGSQQKTWRFQKTFLAKEEYIPNAIEVVYAFTSYHKVRGVCRLYGIYVRTSSVDEDGRHVIVGDNQADGVSVCEFRDDEYENYVGALSARNTS